jgi:teichuronic acid biosynthesis glycosyltransferase TuaG
MNEVYLDSVSIVTPTYNSENFISETIQSILNQSYTNFELIVIDDCSKDNTVEIVKTFSEKDSRFNLIQLELNSGAAVARNIGLENSKGRFIAFCDCDDIWFENKLEYQIRFMLEKSIPISFTSYQLINEKGVSMNKVINAIDKITYLEYLKNTIIGMSTAMIDTSLVKEFRFENIRTRQDTMLWITLLKRGHVAYGIKEVLVKYTVRSNSISANKFKAASKVWDLYYNMEKMGLFKSSYYFIFYVLNAIKKRL